MSIFDGSEALRRANPRTKAGFAQAVEAAAAAVDAQIAAVVAGGAVGPARARPRRRRPHSQSRRLAVFSAAGASVAAAIALAVFLTAGSTGGGPGIENAAAAVKRAATVTAASAERSGTAVVRMTHGGQPWAGKSVRWNADDIAVVDAPSPARPTPRELRLVGGLLYAQDPDGAWRLLGSPESIDPGSGTTPAEYLAAVREDIGGTTLRRITAAMSGPTARTRRDGSVVYSGTVAAGVIARETGFKEGHAIRVLPFGYVAHDEAADPSATLDAAVTLGADGIVREIAVTWGTGASAWTYTVTYSLLGSTPAPTAPRDARPFRDSTPVGPPPSPTD